MPTSACPLEENTASRRQHVTRKRRDKSAMAMCCAVVPENRAMAKFRCLCGYVISLVSVPPTSHYYIIRASQLYAWEDEARGRRLSNIAAARLHSRMRSV